MFQRILGGTRWQEILHEIETRKSYSSSERTFFKQKVNSVFTVNRDTLNSMMSDGAVPDKVPSLWLNILEAAHYDLKMGTYASLARHKDVGGSLHQLESCICASFWFTGECMETSSSLSSVYIGE